MGHLDNAFPSSPVQLLSLTFPGKSDTRDVEFVFDQCKLRVQVLSGGSKSHSPPEISEMSGDIPVAANLLGDYIQEKVTVLVSTCSMHLGTWRLIRHYSCSLVS